MSYCLQKPTPKLIEADDDQNSPFDTDEQPDYVDGIDTRFPINDDYDDDEIDEDDGLHKGTWGKTD